MYADGISDLISIINVGLINRELFVMVRFTKMGLNILHILYIKGCILNYVVKGNKIVVFLKYYKGKSVLKELKRVSRVGRPIYWSIRRMSLITYRYSFSGFYIVSTVLGLIPSDDLLLGGAYEKFIMGKVLLKVSF